LGFGLCQSRRTVQRRQEILRVLDRREITRRSVNHQKEYIMVWNTPKVIEIAVGMEINCYACAELTL
jgi:coenzyme PQQ precursor peptide PqqA